MSDEQAILGQQRDFVNLKSGTSVDRGGRRVRFALTVGLFWRRICGSFYKA